jgi:hypothetical protein
MIIRETARAYNANTLDNGAPQGDSGQYRVVDAPTDTPAL